MKSKTKRIVVVLILAMLIAAAFGIYAWRFLCFRSAVRAQEDTLRLTAELSSVQERARLYAVRSALERENNEQAALLSTLSERSSSFTNSLLILVNPWNTVPEDYEVQLDTVEGYLVDRRCAAALTAMLADCRAAGFEPIICSAYRTQEYQEKLYRNKILRLMAEGVPKKDAPSIAAQSVALPGTSEHQLGLAVDLISETYTNLDQWQERTAVQQWLMANCYNYGFILRYPNGTSETTGIIYEPWHYRYVGTETAKAVQSSALVFEDYLNTLG